MQFTSEHAQRQTASAQWLDLQNPLHVDVTPSWAHSPEATKVHGGASRDRLLEPLRVGGPLSSQLADVDFHGASSQPQHAQGLGGMSHMVELLQYAAASQSAPGAVANGELLRRTMAEISKQGLGEASGHVAGIPDQTSVSAGWPAGGVMGAIPQDMSGWACGWPQQGGAPGLGDSDRLIEELNNYIRLQAQEYLDGQAEWSRQLVEVRGECYRELGKVKREKEEIERVAKQELLRSQQRNRDVGPCAVDGSQGSAESTRSTSKPTSAGSVSIDEYQQVHRMWTAAEDRIRELEQYIKDQAAKQLLSADTQVKEKDEEVQRLREAVASTSNELRQANSEVQALRMHNNQKVSLWENGARRLLAMAEQFLNFGQGAPVEGEELENGHFGRTATKLSLTLSHEEGGDVGSLRRILKDVLKNGKEKGSKRSMSKGKDESAASETAIGITNGSLAAMGTELRQAQINQDKPDERKVAEDSNASSRDTSPGRVSQNTGQNGSATTRQPRVAHFVCQFANDLRQLMAMSQQSPGISPPRTPAESSPSSVGASSSPSMQLCGDQARIQKLIESVAPVRKNITQNIIVVEKMLRGLDRDLKKRCEELLGCAELEAGNIDNAFVMAAEEEAKRHIPVSEADQLQSVVSLRHAQRRSSDALAEFVRLPQQLKMVFDATKQLSSEVHGLARSRTLESVPPALLLHSDAQQVSGVCGFEQRQRLPLPVAVTSY